jgi:hypothetical protein
MGFFEIEELFALGWLETTETTILLISASWVARTTGLRATGAWEVSYTTSLPTPDYKQRELYLKT